MLQWFNTSMHVTAAQQYPNTNNTTKQQCINTKDTEIQALVIAQNFQLSMIFIATITYSSLKVCCLNLPLNSFSRRVKEKVLSTNVSPISEMTNVGGLSAFQIVKFRSKNSVLNLLC